VTGFWDRYLTDAEDAKLWDFWLHKVYDDKSFEDWRRSLMPAEPMTKKQILKTVERSFDVAQMIDPGAGA
jgi:hypothetical protein